MESVDKFYESSKQLGYAFSEVILVITLLVSILLLWIAYMIPEDNVTDVVEAEITKIECLDRQIDSVTSSAKMSTCKLTLKYEYGNKTYETVVMKKYIIDGNFVGDKINVYFNNKTPDNVILQTNKSLTTTLALTALFITGFGTINTILTADYESYAFLQGFVPFFIMF